MATKSAPPSITQTSFNCPHCGALAQQFWWDTYAKRTEKNATPHRPKPEDLEHLLASAKVEPEVKEGIAGYLRKAVAGDVFIERQEPTQYLHDEVHNLSVSTCYNCQKHSVWIHTRLVYPASRTGEEPNADLPEDVLRDYEEARTIVGLSPRGAAALLRLAIQKLCAHLGETGENINADIASLVRKGLHKRIQQALDIVRVIGNEAVHPGQIDLRDDPDTAHELFRLVNLIAETMISQPKHIDDMYGRLPEGKRKAIEERDQKKT
jgi:hypothetical protein